MNAQAEEGRRLKESLFVTWSWHLVGYLSLVDGKLVFPDVPSAAGVYRFTFLDSAGMRSGVYVGEADLLKRRFQHYRTPGPSQQTNLRINPIMIGALEAGGCVSVEIVTRAQVEFGDDTTGPLDLGAKAARVLVERAAEVAARHGDVPVLNR